MSEQNTLAACKALKRPDLVVCVGYGDEMPVFSRARALWEFYGSHFPGIEIVYVRDTDKLGKGETVREGRDLLIGVGSYAKNTDPDYATSGRWSMLENARQIYRQMAIYDYFLRSRSKPFYLYQSTITSVVDFRGLLTVLDQLPTTRCYAGMPGQLNKPPELAGLIFCCGTNNIFSSDLLEVMRSRYNAEEDHAYAPNDIWQALVLNDIPRIPIPFFSFTKPRAAGSNFDDVLWKTRRLIELGHYHFRIKTTSEQEGLAAREDVDPWIMLKVMESILATPAAPDALRSCLLELATFSEADENGLLPHVLPQLIFTSPRPVALSDHDFPE